MLLVFFSKLHWTYHFTKIDNRFLENFWLGFFGISFIQYCIFCNWKCFKLSLSYLYPFKFFLILLLQLRLHTLYWKRVWIQDIPVSLWILIGLLHFFFLQEYFVGGFVISTLCYVETCFLQYYSLWDVHHMKAY